MEEEINTMVENESEYVYATLILRGKGLDPQAITDSLGLNPSMSFNKGDYRNETDRWNHNYWSLTSQGKIQSDDLTSHIEWLMKEIEPIKTKLIDNLNNKNIQAEISCFWILPSEHEYINLDFDMYHLKK